MWEYAIIGGPGILLEHGVTPYWLLEGFIYRPDDAGKIEIIMLFRPDFEDDGKGGVVYHGGSKDKNAKQDFDRIWSDYI